MAWLELSFAIADEDMADLLADALGEVGFDSFETSEAMLKAYVDENLFNKDAVHEILKQPFFRGVEWISTLPMPERNWNQVWESNYDPVIINERCRVRAPFHAPDNAYEYDLLIEPRMSFGTAHHETTSLVMKLMFTFSPAGKRVLDMGCGTAILAILAMKMGAKSAVAIDIDQWAYENAIDNVAINDVNHVSVELGDVRLLACRTFDYMLANINRNILLADMKHYAQCLLSGGYLIISGFYEDDLPAIQAEAASNCLNYVQHISCNRWVAAVYYKR
ncbi:MAG TPA: 50S ribosomal protein L11 methyltransferase [Bacteroidales bacterium]|nr:50S ribosomal protein L11 methyltransferase [Bacteroidales bacterium]